MPHETRSRGGDGGVPITRHAPRATGLHVAIIMDGNGRWAIARGLSRSAGHVSGARNARRIVEAAPSLGIRVLTLYAFSADNWNRPKREVTMLMRLFRRYLQSEVPRCVANGVRLTIIGRRDRLPAEVRSAIDAAESATRGGRTLDLRVALDYSARDSLVRAARRAKSEHVSREQFARLIGEVDHAREPARDVDLLVRTGGEQRLSDFLLWECAYAELYFSKALWPDFAPADLEDAVAEFNARERRFGAIAAAAAG